MGNESFFGANTVGQEGWERRGVNEARIAALETRLATAEAELALIDSGAWPSWTPTLTQNNVAVAKTVTYARYQRVGRDISFRLKLVVTGTGTAGTAVRVGLPVACVETADYPMGSAFLFDASTGFSHKAFPSPAAAASEVFLLPTDGTVADVLGITGFTAALASGDVIAVAGSFEAAS